jgi:ATP-dependent Clp protease ATP-binding subunit ClpA
MENLLYNSDLSKSLSDLERSAAKNGRKFLTKNDIYLMALLNSAKISKIFKHYGIDIRLVTDHLVTEIEKSIFNSISTQPAEQTKTETYRKILGEAIDLSISIHQEKLVSFEDLLSSLILDDLLMHDPESTSYKFKFNSNDVLESLRRSSIKSQKISKQSQAIQKSIDENMSLMLDGMRDMGDQEDEKEDSVLLRFGVNLNAKVKKEPVTIIGRENELESVVMSLSKLRQANVILTGRSGVGKTSVVELLADKINKNEVPEYIKGHTIYEISVAALLSGTKFRGDFEKRVEALIREIKNRENLIIFFDEIHMVIDSGASGGSVDLSNMLKPILASSSSKVIGATTTKEYEQYIKKDPAFMRRFSTVQIEEPSKSDTVKILGFIKKEYEKHYALNFTPEVIESIVDLSDRYVSNDSFPNKAISLLDEIGSYVKNKKTKGVITKDIVAEVLSRKTGIPINDVTGDQRANMSKLSLEMGKSVFGQKKAINELTDCLSTSFLGLTNKNKPYGSFFFVGPTGVGKTEVAKTLAEKLKMDLLRFDMSEYQTEASVTSLIGAPPSYVGYEDGSQLIEKVIEKPYSIVLLDEVEKAHPRIFDLFLQILDEGTLKSASGKSCSFKDTIIIMTSNVGSKSLNKRTTDLIGENKSSVADYDKAISDFFRPEFISRFDNIIHFEPLVDSVTALIVDKYLSEINGNLKERGVKISLSSAAKKIIIANSCDSAMGARKMQRVFDSIVTKPVAKLILDNPNASVIKVGASKKELSFSV